MTISDGRHSAQVGTQRRHQRTQLLGQSFRDVHAIDDPRNLARREMRVAELGPRSRSHRAIGHRIEEHFCGNRGAALLPCADAGGSGQGAAGAVAGHGHRVRVGADLVGVQGNPREGSHHVVKSGGERMLRSKTVFGRRA